MEGGQQWIRIGRNGIHRRGSGAGHLRKDRYGTESARADNSVFICFAPKDDPKIAVAAYIENAGFGATWAAPIASLLVEKYLNGEISDKRRPLEDRVLQGNLMSRVKAYK